MKWLLLVALALSGSVVAHEVDSSDLGVTIYRDVRLSDNHQGYAYWVENENAYPVWFGIALTEQENVHDGLAKGRVYLFPYQTQFLGTVMQRNSQEPYRWRYRWEVTPASGEPENRAAAEADER